MFPKVALGHFSSCKARPKILFYPKSPELNLRVPVYCRCLCKLSIPIASSGENIAFQEDSKLIDIPRIFNQGFD